MSVIEAAIDFSDEGDVAAHVGVTAAAEGEALARDLARKIGAHLDDGRRGELVRSGFQVVLAGPPNVGKSSLLNSLARRDVAIVAEEAGTTRDVIEVRLDLEGMPILVSDTAGVREAQSKVEQEGVRRTFGRAQSADLVLWVSEAGNPVSPPPSLAAADRVLRVVNKCDLGGVLAGAASAEADSALAVSALTGFGLEALIARIAAIARARIGETEDPPLTQARHREQLEQCQAALKAFLSTPHAGLELRAEDLRRAANALGRLIGAVAAEDVLAAVFGRFCIGK